MDAVDYGVPQHRWRVFIVGVRSDLGRGFCFPTPTHELDALLYSKYVSKEYWERHRVPLARRPAPPRLVARRVDRLRSLFPMGLLEPWRTVRDAICDLPDPRADAGSSGVSNHLLNPGARSYPGHTGSLHDEPAKALKAGDHGVPGGENTLRLKDGALRYFTVRECARLQTFPDEWMLEGSWTESMRQLGNAVPVRLAEHVAKALVPMITSGATSFEPNRC
jgi:DNA (cytosine-5)-methyltransferase 1